MKRAGCLLFLLALFFLCRTAFAGQAGNPDVAVFSSTDDPFSVARVESLLAQAGSPARHITLQDNWDGISLLVLVRPVIPADPSGRRLSFTQKIASHYLLGGRVLLVGLNGAGEFPRTPVQEIWDHLAQYFWDTGLHDINGTLEDADHRALYFPGAANLGAPSEFKRTIERLLAAYDTLPDTLPAEDFGPVPSVELRGPSLLIDDKPVLLKATGDYDFVNQVPMREHAARLRAFHEAGFNSIITVVHFDVDDAKVRQFLEIARANALYIQFLVQGPLDSNEPVRKEYLLKFLRFRRHPMLIGWVFSDDMFDAFYPYIRRAAEIVRRYDQRLPMTSTFMDPRQPDLVHDWNKWKTLLQFPLDYLYPMQKDPATLGVKGDIGGGLKDVDRLAANTHRIWGNLFSEQFLQAHMQGTFAEKVGLQPWTEHLVPLAGQERLLAWHALLSGVKGLVFFYPESLEDQGMGRNRRNELSIVWHEIGLVEDVLAAGETPVPLHTSDDSVEASQIQSAGSSVIFIARDKPYYNRFIENGRCEGLRIKLPAVAADAHVYQLDWPHIDELEINRVEGGASLTVRPFNLTALLLVTADGHRVSDARMKIDRGKEAVAQGAIEVLDDERIKTEVTAAHIPSNLRGNSGLLESAAASLERARSSLASGNAAGAFGEARAGLTALEEFRAQAMRAAMADADRMGAGPSARVYLNIYFSLPVYAYVTRGTDRIIPGQLRREILARQGKPAWDFLNRVPY